MKICFSEIKNSHLLFCCVPPALPHVVLQTMWDVLWDYSPLCCYKYLKIFLRRLYNYMIYIRYFCFFFKYSTDSWVTELLLNSFRFILGDQDCFLEIRTNFKGIVNSKGITIRRNLHMKCSFIVYNILRSEVSNAILPNHGR